MTHLEPRSVFFRTHYEFEEGTLNLAPKGNTQEFREKKKDNENVIRSEGFQGQVDDSLRGPRAGRLTSRLPARGVY